MYGTTKADMNLTFKTTFPLRRFCVVKSMTLRYDSFFNGNTFNVKCKKEEKKCAKKVFSFSMPNYLLKYFHRKKCQIESYPTDLISLSQAERSDLYRIRNLCRIMEF